MIRFFLLRSAYVGLGWGKKNGGVGSVFLFLFLFFPVTEPKLIP